MTKTERHELKNIGSVSAVELRLLDSLDSKDDLIGNLLALIRAIREQPPSNGYSESDKQIQDTIDKLTLIASK